MNFLRALRKVDDQKPEPKRERGRVISQAEGKFGHLVPDLVDDPNMKIGSGAQTDIKVRVDVNPKVSEAAVGAPVFTENNRLDVDSFANVFVDEARVNRHLVAITDSRSAFCEEYRNLRATLLQKSKKQ